MLAILDNLDHKSRLGLDLAIIASLNNSRTDHLKLRGFGNLAPGFLALMIHTILIMVAIEAISTSWRTIAEILERSSLPPHRLAVLIHHTDNVNGFLVVINESSAASDSGGVVDNKDIVDDLMNAVIDLQLATNDRFAMPILNVALMTVA